MLSITRQQEAGKCFMLILPVQTLSGNSTWGWLFLSSFFLQKWDVVLVWTAFFRHSLPRTLGLPRSSPYTSGGVRKPPRDQLHRAAECAGPPPACADTTRTHSIRNRGPAGSKLGDSRVTAASKSTCRQRGPPGPHHGSLLSSGSLMSRGHSGTRKPARGL